MGQVSARVINVIPGLVPDFGFRWKSEEAEHKTTHAK